MKERDLDRERRHDEQWQMAVLDGMNRMLDVLHDISDAVTELGDRVKELERQPTDASPANDVPGSSLMSLEDVADLIGTTPASLRGMRYQGRGPVAMKVGRRLRFHRADVDAWLADRRDPSAKKAPAWSNAVGVKGKIGASLAEPKAAPGEQSFCLGSHTEPFKASPYPGRAVCRVCRWDVGVNKDGKLRKHIRRLPFA